MKILETTDYLFNENIKIIQHKNGYRFSVDALLLADFTYENKEGLSYLEIGTGSGIIPITLIHFDKEKKIKKIYSVEIQKSLYILARKNILLNNINNIELINDDIKNIKKALPSGKIDIVFSNPPFFENSRGRRNPDNEKYIARHEVYLTLKDLVKASNYLLKYEGKLKLIYPVKRLPALIETLSKNSFGISKLLPVYPKKGEEAKLILTEAIKGKKFTETKILPPVYINKNDKEYSVYINNILKK